MYQIIGEITQPLRDKIISILRLNKNSIGFRIYKSLMTFIFVDIAWVYFRADSFHIANEIIASMVHADNPWVLFDGSLYRLGLNEKNFRLMIMCIGVLAISDIFKNRGIVIRKVIVDQDYIFRWIIIAFSVFFIITFGVWGPGYNANNFIYFQF